jgi:hypothetical protein
VVLTAETAQRGNINKSRHTTASKNNVYEYVVFCSHNFTSYYASGTYLKTNTPVRNEKEFNQTGDKICATLLEYYRK